MGKITKKQTDFADHYLANGMNATKSYMAIYKVTNNGTARTEGCKLLAHPNVHAYIEERRAALTAATQIDQEWVLKRLVDISDRCVQIVPVMEFDPAEKRMVQKTDLDEQGNIVGVYMFDSTGANRATELVGKMLGVFEKDNKQKTPEAPATFTVLIKKPVED